jgi:hypothetical protein
MVDELPEGAIARYERDVVATANQIVEDEVLNPTFEIVSNPTIRLSDIKSRRFTIINRPVDRFGVPKETILSSLPEIFMKGVH